MPMTEMEELKQLLSQPLPGGRGFQQAKADRMEHLRGVVVTDLITQLVDVNGAADLAALYLEVLCGKDPSDPRIVSTEEFQSLWSDYHPDDDEDVLVNEAKDARKRGDNFQPNTALYGRAIFIYDANNDSADNSHIVGNLKRITGPHTYLIEVDGENQEWEVDSVDDLEVPEVDSEPLYLWNAWR